MEIDLNVQIAFGKMTIFFTMLILLSHDHGREFHLLISSIYVFKDSKLFHLQDGDGWGWKQEGIEEAQRERVLGEKTGIGIVGHFRANVETHCNENSMDSMRVTLAMTPSNGGYRA